MLYILLEKIYLTDRAKLDSNFMYIVSFSMTIFPCRINDLFANRTFHIQRNDILA